MMINITTAGPFKSQRAADDFMQQWGFAAFNCFEHVLVEPLETDQFTLSVKLRDGRQITFSFLQTNDEPSGCVDICVHNPKHGVYVKNGNGEDRPVQEYLGLARGGPVESRSHRVNKGTKDDRRAPTLLTVLLDTPPPE